MRPVNHQPFQPVSISLQTPVLGLQLAGLYLRFGGPHGPGGGGGTWEFEVLRPPLTFSDPDPVRSCQVSCERVPIPDPRPVVQKRRDWTERLKKTQQKHVKTPCVMV